MNHSPTATVLAFVIGACLPSMTAQSAQPQATLMPIENSIAGVGLQVWVVVDGDIPPPQSSGWHAPLARPVPVSLASYTQDDSGYAIYQRASYDAQVAYEDRIAPWTPKPLDRDAEIIASIPSYAGMAVPLDPDRFKAAPVALHFESATIEEILEQLIPLAYRIELDVPESLRKKRFRIVLDTTVANAFSEVMKRTGVAIQPYHRLGLVMVSYQGAPQ